MLRNKRASAYKTSMWSTQWIIKVLIYNRSITAWTTQKELDRPQTTIPNVLARGSAVHRYLTEAHSNFLPFRTSCHRRVTKSIVRTTSALLLFTKYEKKQMEGSRIVLYALLPSNHRAIALPNASMNSANNSWSIQNDVKLQITSC